MKVAIIGAGASGIFAALELKRLNPLIEVVVLEKSSELLSKVRLSGGGRCNCTNVGPFDPLHVYPRGGAFLRPLLLSFGPKETVAWFQEHGVATHEEEGGRVFPLSNSSETIIACFITELSKHHITVEKGVHIVGIFKTEKGLSIREEQGKERVFDAVLVASGSAKKPLMWVAELGIDIVPQVPSLFTFNCPDSFLSSLSGLALEVEVEMLGKKVRGPLLITHWGFSGPAILKLSSLLAPTLAACEYITSFTVDWLPQRSFKEIAGEIDQLRKNNAGIKIKKSPFNEVRESLWLAFLKQLGIDEHRRWGELSSHHKEALLQLIKRGQFACKGISSYKQEFVTAGGVSLKEIDSKTLEAKKVPGLFFSGEILDIDGVTGGFNLQAAWTTGYHAAHGIAGLYQFREIKS